ncbi:hypothetical protein [Klebsiella sp. 2680]|nr:hypothetical protein [Klebsiella sp. 2680]
MSLALTGRHDTAFKSVPDGFVAYHDHVLSVRAGDAQRRRHAAA